MTIQEPERHPLSVAQSPGALILVDGHGVIVDASASALTLLGIERGRTLGQPGGAIGLDRSKADSRGRYLIRSAGPADAALVLEVVVAQLGPQGELYQLAPVDDEQAEASARSTNLQLQDSYFTSLSHALRSPLNAILNTNEVLLGELYGPISDSQRSALEAIERSARQQLQLISDIVDFARARGGTLEIDLAPVSAQALCDASTHFIKQISVERSIRIRARHDSAAPLIVCDERRMRQVLVTLLMRAARSAPQGGQVGLDIAADPQAGRLTLSVWDNGPALDHAQQAAIFSVEYFQEADGGGAALSMPLVRRYVELQGGSISVSSSPDEGTRFTISLPWHPDGASGAAPGGSALSEASRGRLLLVDDNPVASVATSDYLIMRGYDLMIAESGRQALDMIHANNFDLVLMDVQMPDMDGLEVIRQLRATERFRTLPIMSLTALAMSGDRERCLAAGADVYCAKPVSLRELTRQIEELLARTRQG